MKQSKKARKERLVKRLEALLEAGNDALFEYALKLINEDDAQVKGGMKIIPWVRERIKARLQEARA